MLFLSGVGVGTDPAQVLSERPTHRRDSCKLLLKTNRADAQSDLERGLTIELGQTVRTINVPAGVLGGLY